MSQRVPCLVMVAIPTRRNTEGPNMATVVEHSARLPTTASVASSFEQLTIKGREKVKRKTKETNDPLKVLDPAKKKLTSVEAQRVLAVVDDAIRRAEVVTLLPYVTENIDRFSVILGADLTRVVLEHDSLQNNYRTFLSKQQLEQKRARSSSPQIALSSQPSDSRRSSTSSEEPELNEPRISSGKSSISSTSGLQRIKSAHEEDGSSEEIANMGKLVQQSIRTVLRMFSVNPTAIAAIRKERSERSFEANTMIDELYVLRSVLFERLLTTPNEMNERRVYLTAVMDREKKSNVLAKKLQSELQNAIDDRDNEVSKRNEIIRRLKNDIYNIETTSEEMNHRIVNEASKQEIADVKASDGKRAKLSQEILEVRKKLESERTAHRESELALRKRKYKIETEVENWIQKFDGDMGERQDEFDALDAVYTEEKKQLQELEERFKTLEKEYTTIVEERRIAKEKAEAAEKELNMKIRAARLIQAMWRAHKARKALQKKKKKGKKGKKGKKSGKGKRR